MLNPAGKYAEREVAYAKPMENRHGSMGDRIRGLRLARGLSQVELAKATGVTKSAVSQWESGSTANIKLRTFLLLTEALGTSFQYLIYGPTRAPGGGEVVEPHRHRTANARR